MSEANPPTPPPQRDVAYAGRIILGTDALRDEVSLFADVWTRRIEIMNLTATITYDDNRAIVDVYGTTPATLPAIANVLADRGGARLDGRFVDGSVITWLPPTPECNCSGRVRVRIDPRLLSLLQNGDQQVFYKDLRAMMRGTIYWATTTSSRYYVEPPSDLGCPGQQDQRSCWWRDNIMFDLPPEATHDANVAIVLALGGGTLPDDPRILSIGGGS
ncbi:MAG TPA: hypothetical protein VGM39_08815 [Kofleriaceae bacterium]